MYVRISHMIELLPTTPKAETAAFAVSPLSEQLSMSRGLLHEDVQSYGCLYWELSRRCADVDDGFTLFDVPCVL